MDRSPSALCLLWGLASVNACFAEAITYPLDLLKTRLQLQGSSAAAAPLSLSGMASSVVRTEGMKALFAGMSVALLRQLFNAGISVALYPSVRAALLGPAESSEAAPLWKRAAAGAATGCIGQLLAQPTDVIKVRVQADGRARAAGLQPRYKGSLDAARSILAAEGLRGFYASTYASVWRAAIIQAAGISSYDHTKQWATQLVGSSEGYAPQVVAALVCGVISAAVSCPLDIVKTRVINEPSRYKGPNDCLMQLIRKEGFFSMWKGFLPTYQRQALFNFAFWVGLEESQKLTGSKRL